MFIETHAIKKNPPKCVQITHITLLGLLAAGNDMEEMNFCAKLDQSLMADVNHFYNNLYKEILRKSKQKPKK